MSKELEKDLELINNPISLREIKAIDFFDALNSHDFSKICETHEQFSLIVDAYQSLVEDKDVSSKMEDSFIRRILILTTAYNVLYNFGWFEEQKEVLAKFKVKVSEETLDEDLKNLLLVIDRSKVEFDRFKKAKGKEEDIERQEMTEQKTDGYVIFARLEVSLGFSFDYETITLAKIAGLSVALREKIKAESVSDNK